MGVHGLAMMLRSARKRSGLSQRAVAAEVGIDFTYLSKIENGHITTGISESLLRRLATLYQIDADALLVAAHKCPHDLSDLLATNLEAVMYLRRFLQRAQEAA